MIRPPVFSDLKAIARLNRLVHEMHAQNAPAHFKQPSGTDDFLSWFTPVLQERDSFVVVAEVSGDVVGYLYAKEVKKAESWIRPGTHFFMLHHIAVDPSFQRGGYGSGLMNALFEEGAKRGISAENGCRDSSIKNHRNEE
ncbi:MAG: GNAT family N-acetyltransferase [Verrucomicrobia bacterium]|nr:GNAT family N-acetyltransferase [Verrucomicrobiota bacterium]MCH8528910.1 GNAT family N-acetyltransferase [Kiritimatiellia bacterium]